MKKAVWAVVILVIFIIVSTAVYRTRDRVREETAVTSEYEDMIEGQGLIIRSETPYDISQNLYSYVDDSARVANHEKIAALYSDKSDRGLLDSLNLLDKQINQLDVQDTSIDKDDKVAVETEIKKDAQKLSQLIYEKDVSSMASIKSEMLSLSKTDASSQKKELTQLSSLKAQRDKIANQISNSYTPVYSPKSGVFVPSTDGFESEITPNIIEALTPSSLKKYLEQTKKITKNVHQYKIDDDFTWYVAVSVSASEASDLKVGSTVNLRFPNLSMDTVECTIEKISEAESGRVVVTCSSMGDVGGLYHVRQTAVQLIKNTYTGFIVDKSAIHIDDGKTGVFIDSGGIAKFKEANILINEQDVAIIKQDSTNKDALTLYDSVIVEGKNMYDGKLLK